MVLGLRSAKNKNTSVFIHYVVHIQEIKPWPPSQSLKAVRSVVLVWENGDSRSGTTSPVSPSVGLTAAEGKIEFNQTFRLDVGLKREGSAKSNDKGAFQKNLLEFNLYEPRRDKSKGQHLGTAIIDLAAHGAINEAATITVPVNSKRNFRNTAQPLLSIMIQPFDKNNASTSSSEELLKESSIANEGNESITHTMNEDSAEEAEIASFTDDDVSSHSSLTISPTSEANADFSLRESPNEKNTKDTSEDWKERKELDNDESHKQLYSMPSLVTVDDEVKVERTTNDPINRGESLSKEEIIMRNGHIPVQNLEETIINPDSKEKAVQDVLKHDSINTTGEVAKSFDVCSHSVVLEKGEPDQDASVHLTPQGIGGGIDEAVSDDGVDCVQKTGLLGNITEFDYKTDEKDKYLSHEDQGDNASESQSISSDGNLEHNSFFYAHKYQEVEHMIVDLAKSNQVSYCESSRNKTTDCVQNPKFSIPLNSHHSGNFQENEHENERNSSANEGVFNKQNINPNLSKSKHFSGVKRNLRTNNKVQELEQRVKLLETELRETAAIEISLYSITAEHGSSTHKLHSPCRRLSRLYRHTLDKDPVERRARTARSIVSGLTLVARTCGNDVPRLTFWLSNIVVLRAIVRGMVGSYSAEKTSRRFKEVSLLEDSNDCENPQMLLSLLKNIETWVFDRIVESVWWQALTPYMQFAKDSELKKRANSKGSFGKTSGLGDQQEASIKAWKAAFKDALGRLCPVRSGGHECGCLPMLAKLVMEQCISRLDVAMFNAILRDSDDDMSMDPLSDPIFDLTVLPISSRVLTFGLGAQLKNAIGSWSRYLSDLFDMDEEDSCNENDQNSFRPFSLLNALSDLLMTPKDMLLEESLRKEAFPKFSPSLINSILSRFQPDDFCPYPVPPNVLKALDSQESLEDEEITSIPYSVSPIIYAPPSIDSIESIVGEMQSSSPLCRSSSSLVRKGHTSDDELEELDSPFSSITSNSPLAPKGDTKGFNCSNAIRYQLLREVWENDE